MNATCQYNIQRDELVLEGLPGDNPLGFLAALKGTLRVLSDRWTDRGIRNDLGSPEWLETRDQEIGFRRANR